MWTFFFFCAARNGFAGGFFPIRFAQGQKDGLIVACSYGMMGVLWAGFPASLPIAVILQAGRLRLMCNMHKIM